MRRKKKLPKLKLKRGTHGLGLFALEEIKRGQLIMPYVGEIITNEEADKRGGRYLFELNKKHTLDGKSRKNLARYINHSCKPNCYAEVDEEEETVEIFAKKKIVPGEELHYDYGEEYFKDIIGGVKKCECEIHGRKGRR